MEEAVMILSLKIFPLYDMSPSQLTQLKVKGRTWYIAAPGAGQV